MVTEKKKKIGPPIHIWELWNCKGGKEKDRGDRRFSFQNWTDNQEIFHVFLFLFLVVANRSLLSSCGSVIWCRSCGAGTRLSVK